MITVVLYATQSRRPAGLDINDTGTDTDVTRMLGLEGMGVIGVEDGEAAWSCT